jgi:hypothetical protein
MNERVRKGIHIVRTVAAIFPYLCFGKKSCSWSNTECRSDLLLKRPDGCKLEQFEASLHKGRSERKVLVIRTDDALDSWASGQYITSSGRMLLDWWASGRNTTSSGRMQGIWLHCLEIRTESSRNISLKKISENWLNPCLKTSLYMLLTDECPGVSLGRSDDKLGIRLLLSCRLCRVFLESKHSFLMLVTLILS